MIPERESIVQERDALRCRVRELTTKLASAQAAERSARQAIEERAQSIMRLAHDLRNPISGIRLAVDSTLQTLLTIDQRRELEVVRRAADNALDLVNELIEKPKTCTTLPAVKFDLNELLDDVIGESSPAATAKGLALTLRRSSDEPNRLLCDPRRLRRILTNLVGNAVKFTEVGEVTLRVRFGIEERMTGYVHFIVEDTGPGIASEHQSMIFESFRQVQPTESSQGVGLGLSICLELTKQLDGQIWVESELGHGSRFHLKIPLRAPAASTSYEPTRRSATSLPSLEMAPLRILLAEDCEVNQMVVAGFLGSFGHQVDIVSTGRRAMESLDDQRYDAVLMDLEMPEVDGLQATRTLRSSANQCHRHVPIIGMTAHVDPRVTRQCLNAGMDACLSKPLDPKQIAEVLRKLTQRPATSDLETAWHGPHAPVQEPTGQRPGSPTTGSFEALPYSASGGLVRVDD